MRLKDLPTNTKRAAHIWYVGLGWPNGMGDEAEIDMTKFEWEEVIANTQYYNAETNTYFNADLLTDEVRIELDNMIDDTDEVLKRLELADKEWLDSIDLTENE